MWVWIVYICMYMLSWCTYMCMCLIGVHKYCLCVVGVHVYVSSCMVYIQVPNWGTYMRV